MLEIGKTYIDGMGNRRTIHDIRSTGAVQYTKNGAVKPTYCDSNYFVTHFTDPRTKPLDQAFKTLDKQECRHRNIRKDQYFTAMIYETCKDCGKALN